MGWFDDIISDVGDFITRPFSAGAELGATAVNAAQTVAPMIQKAAEGIVPPKPDDAEVQKKLDEARLEQMKPKGRAATIFFGEAGAKPPTSLAKNILLGG